MSCLEVSTVTLPCTEEAGFLDETRLLIGFHRTV
jgi:hypothetical protein